MRTTHAVIVAVAFFSCSGSQAYNTASTTPPTEAAKFWQRLQAEHYDSEWAFGPGFDKPQPGTGPHGDTVQIYVNPTMDEALHTKGLKAWPEGSWIAKNGFSNGALHLIPVMEKRSDGWYFAEYKPDGTTVAAGLKEASCVSCHQSGDDFVRSFRFP